MYRYIVVGDAVTRPEATNGELDETADAQANEYEFEKDAANGGGGDDEVGLYKFNSVDP